MILHDCVQGGDEWNRLRLGIPTASNFHRIYQSHRKQPSKQRDLYLHELVHDFAQGRRDEPFESKWTRRGQALEPQAIFAFTMEHGRAVRRIGFVTRDDGLCGGSPDGLLDPDSILEVKCPSPQIHHGYVNGKDPKHTAQCQGLMYVCERESTNLWIYSDTEPSVLKVIARDDEWIDGFVPVLAEFLDELQAMKAEVAHAHGVTV